MSNVWRCILLFFLSIFIVNGCRPAKRKEELDNGVLEILNAGQSHIMGKIEFLGRKAAQLQERTTQDIVENRLMIENELRETKRELITEMGNLRKNFVDSLGEVKTRMVNQYKLLRQNVVPKLDGIFGKVSNVENAVKSKQMNTILKSFFFQIPQC